MIHTIITYQVKPGQVDNALALIEEFVAGIALHEPGTHHYYSYQDEEDAHSFTHLMAFRDLKARDLHRKSPHCALFVEHLYPLCVEPPRPRTLVQVASKV